MKTKVIDNNKRLTLTNRYSPHTTEMLENMLWIRSSPAFFKVQSILHLTDLDLTDSRNNGLFT